MRRAGVVGLLAAIEDAYLQGQDRPPSENDAASRILGPRAAEEVKLRPADKDGIKAFPAGEEIIKISNAIGNMTSIDVAAAEKN